MHYPPHPPSFTPEISWAEPFIGLEVINGKSLVMLYKRNSRRGHLEVINRTNRCTEHHGLPSGDGETNRYCWREIRIWPSSSWLS